MKKSKLIELLLKLDGDPEVLLWNGFVSDWVDIGTVIEYDLVKQTFEDYCRRVEYEEKRNRLSWEYKLSEEEVKSLKKHYRKVCKWEVNEFVDEEQIQNKYYRRKRVVFINAKQKHEETWDRMGRISY